MVFKMYAKYGMAMPQEFNSKERCLEWLLSRQQGFKNSIKLIHKEKNKLVIKTPLLNEYLELYGDSDEVEWLHLSLLHSNAYTFDY